MLVAAPTETKLRYHDRWNALGWAFVALVVYLTLMHPPAMIGPEVFDIGHLFAYGWLMSWFAQIHRATATRLAIGAALCAMGVALEFVQGMTGYRTFDYADMGMNALGVTVGLLLACTPLQNILRTVERRMAR
jgi:hypothetical protein